MLQVFRAQSKTGLLEHKAQWMDHRGGPVEGEDKKVYMFLLSAELAAETAGLSSR